MGYLSDLTINITALRITTGEKLNKLYADIGDKSQLNTTNKTSLVNAINEVKSKSLPSDDPRIANWDTSYRWGDFREFGLGRYKTPAIPFSGLTNETGFYFVNDTNELIPGTTHKQAKVLRLGNSSFSALTSTLILSHNGNELGYRYADTEPTVRLWHSGNLSPYTLFKKRSDLTDHIFYTSSGSINVNTVLGNVAFYTYNNTVGSNNFYHHQSWAFSDAYGYQLRKSPELSGNFGIRTRINGSWTPWENIAYESFVTGQLQNYYTKNESLGLFVGLTNTQSIGGTKTFSSSPIVPTATLNSHAINKGQMESWVTAQIAEGADSIWEHTPQGGLRIRNYNSLATRGGAIAITKGGGATKINAIGIGTSVNSDGNDGLVIGPLSSNLGAYGTVTGPYSSNTAMEGTVIGAFLLNNQRGCTVTGRYNDPILSTTTNTVTDNSPLFIIGNGKHASIRSNAYVMRSDGIGEFQNKQKYSSNITQFSGKEIPTAEWVLANGGGNGSEDYISSNGSQISQFSETKANSQLNTSPLKASGEILGDQDIIGYTAPTVVYLGSDGKWRKWNDSSNGEGSNIVSTAALGISVSNKEVMIRGYYHKTISPELSTIMNSTDLFHVFNKGSLGTSNSTSNVERVFGYRLKNNIGYFNPWMFK